MNLLKKCVAEFIGTLVLVAFACGVAVTTKVDVVATSLAFGLVIVAMAYSIGNVSGCHINPAVSFAMVLRKQISWVEFGAYVASQVLGALAGAGLLALFLKDANALGGNEVQPLLQNAWGDAGVMIALIVEIVLTFVFVLTILGVTDKKHHDGKHAGIVIGLSLTLVHLLGLAFTGTSVNPARSIGPAILQAIAGNTTSLSQVWIWIAGPLLGAALAAILYGFMTKEKK